MKQLRKSGAKPEHPTDRERRVERAVRDLEKIGAAFTVAEVAEKAGISRATIYRSTALRTLIGIKGDQHRPIPPEDHHHLAKKHETLRKKSRELRQQLTESEKSWDEMRERALTAERKLLRAEQQIALLQARLSSSSLPGRANQLAEVTAKLGRAAAKKGRREIARALHPDLFAKDSPAAELATELLKTLNSIID